MESGYYAACAGLIARTDALEVAANNLANINTTGYKAQREYFSSLLAGAAANNPNPLNRAVNDYGVLGGARVDLAPGNMERTSGDLDLAIEGSGFFQVQTVRGVRYTRDGNFGLSQNRQLQTDSGDPVLNDQGQPIQLPTGQTNISSDGTVSVDGNVIAKLALIDLQGAALTPEGANTFSAPAGAAKPDVTSEIRQGMLESSNLSPVAASVGLIGLQRHTELLQKTLNIFYMDFNNTAANELPRVQ